MVFDHFINSEINRIKNILINNQNKNVRFYSKKSKFGELKYNERKNKHITDKLDIFINYPIKSNNTLNSEVWNDNLNIFNNDINN